MPGQYRVSSFKIRQAFKWDPELDFGKNKWAEVCEPCLWWSRVLNF